MTEPATPRKFRGDYGVFVCEHVFQSSRPVTFCVRDWDGSWQFLCGDDDPQRDPIHHVHVGALIARDASLQATASMDVGTFAERESEDDAWDFGVLDPEDEPS